MAHRGWKRDGFTPAKKAKAVEALGRYGNVSDACRVAGISDTTFYRHLGKDAEFARLCELAREQAAKPIETLAWQRAVEGAEEKIIRGGEVVQIRVKPSDAMMRMLLQASNPKKYGRMSRGGPTRRQIERKLRKRIEAELRAERAEASQRDAAQLVEKIAARLEEIEAEKRAEEEARRQAGGGQG